MLTPSYTNHSEQINRSLKIAVIREELVALTGDALHAVVLNQFIYWSERTHDYDQFVREEQQRQPKSDLPLRYGWIYKRVSDLIIETMLGISDSTMRRIIKELVQQRWISERQNPDNKWDKVLQYRTNIVRIQYDLQQLGYGLNGFKLLAATCDSPAATHQVLLEPSTSLSKLQITASKLQAETLNLQNDASKQRQACFSSKITADNSCSAVVDAGEEDVSIQMVKIWNTALADQISIKVYTARRQRLKQILTSVFGGDLQAWQAFCEQVATTPFLRGQGPSGWKARLDWCLSDDKAHHILDGYYQQCWPTDNAAITDKAVNDEAQLWEQCQAHLAVETNPLGQLFKQKLLDYHGPVIYQRWFQDLQIEDVTDQVLMMSHPRPYSRQQCQQRFHLDLLKAAQQLWSQVIKIHVGAPQPSSALTVDKPHRKLYLTKQKVRQQDNGHPTIEIPGSQSFNIMNKGHKHANC